MKLPRFTSALNPAPKKKSPSKKKIKQEFQTHSQVLAMLPHRPVLEVHELPNLQLVKEHALCSPDGVGLQLPNNKSGSKSQALNYFRKKLPEIVSTNVYAGRLGLVVLEGENLISRPANPSKTLADYCLDMFKYQVAPYFAQTKEICVMFDDEENRDLKMTDAKRYMVKYPDLGLSLDKKIESWETVFKSRNNEIDHTISH